MIKKSPFAPKQFPKLKPVNGVTMAVAKASVKYQGREDVVLFEIEPGSTVAGVFTQSLTASAPVEHCQKNLPYASVRSIIVNSGNANAFTGKIGEKHVEQVCEKITQSIDCQTSEVYVASTGVIGEDLPVERICNVVEEMTKNLNPFDWENAAKAIMTTDTYAKGASLETIIEGQSITITGIAKGSGMIAPDMATMLAFVFTDANLCQKDLQRSLKKTVNKTFNCISVDSDTSTSDTLLLVASRKSENQIKTKKSIKAFQSALNEVLESLAKQVIKDGEGASKLITINVSGAKSNKSARKIGLAIANSPLVKTAIAGEDANWGRIVMAIGKAGEKAKRDRLEIVIAGIKICEKGRQVEGYDESLVNLHLKENTIDISVDVGVAKGKACVWGCDLTHDYIRINADYRS